MNLLTLVLAMLAATTVTGPVLVAAFSLGHYGWLPVLLALLLGAFGAAALARRLEAEIKRQDPHWDERRDRPLAPAVLPRPGPRPAPAAGRFDPRLHWRR